MGCPDWPLCHGQLIPPLDDYKAWIEWIHRTVAAAIGFVVLALAFVAVRDHRDRPSLLWPSIGVVVLVGFQAWLGRETVRLNNSGESVTAHLAAAMALVGLLVYILVRSFYPARIGGRGGSQRFTLLAAFGALAVFALLLFGSQVTATSQWYVFPDWPLMNGSLLPPLSEGTSAHVLHRWVAIVVGLIVAAVPLAAWRTQRTNRAILRLTLIAAVLFPIQAVIGGLQILTDLAGWTQTLHVALGALIWAAMAGLVTTSYYAARTDLAPARDDRTDATGGRIGDEETNAERRTRSDTVRAYIALTKPRIIELLLVTTVPAMVLATREVPGHPAWPLGLAHGLDAHRRNARSGQRQRDQLLPRS